MLIDQSNFLGQINNVIKVLNGVYIVPETLLSHRFPDSSLSAVPVATLDSFVRYSMIIMSECEYNMLIVLVNI